MCFIFRKQCRGQEFSKNCTQTGVSSRKKIKVQILKYQSSTLQPAVPKVSCAQGAREVYTKQRQLQTETSEFTVPTATTTFAFLTHAEHKNETKSALGFTRIWQSKSYVSTRSTNALWTIQQPVSHKRASPAQTTECGSDPIVNGIKGRFL